MLVMNIKDDNELSEIDEKRKTDIRSTDNERNLHGPF